MLRALLRSIFGGERAASPGGGEIEEMRRRVDAMQQRVDEIDQISSWRYEAEAARLLAGILSDARYDDPLRLERHGHKVFSQNDEDGLLSEIFRRIGTTNRRFLEIGVGDGLENNTRCLLEQGWSGGWLEGDSGCVTAIQTRFRHEIAEGRLSVSPGLVARESIEELILALTPPRDLDLFSIDIDGNDYHVWQAIACIEPRVVVIEYNAKYRPPMHWVMDYDPAHRWDGSDRFGASLVALAELGQRKGYRLVGCNITGANAFFVRSTLAESGFASPADAASLYQPARYHLSPAFVSGHPAG
jgi:hypothetical protein